MSGKIETIGVIGAGQMGSGIAHVSALAGYNVLLFDVAPEQIETGIATVNGNWPARSAPESWTTRCAAQRFRASRQPPTCKVWPAPTW